MTRDNRGREAPGLCVASLVLLCMVSACTHAPPTPPSPVSVPEPVADIDTATMESEAAEPAAPPEPVVAVPLPPPVEAPPPTPVRVRISAVGDIMLGGTAEPYLRERGYDSAYDGVRHLFADSAIVIGNLEGPLTASEEAPVEKKYLFRSPQLASSQALAAAGFNALDLANNHALDYGMAGLRDTMAALDAVAIRYFGAGETLAAARAPAVLEASGLRVALLGYSNTFPEEFWADETRGGTAFGHEHHVRADVARSTTFADLVIVSFHWGREGTTELRPYQPELAHAAIDAGADVVIGHHPHILQGIERYRDGVILYSLGNFTFGSFSPRARTSAVAHLDFDDGVLAALTLVPVNVNNFEVYFTPQVLVEDAAELVYDELRSISEPLGTKLTFDGSAVVVDLTEQLPVADQAQCDTCGIAP